MSISYMNLEWVEVIWGRIGVGGKLYRASFGGKGANGYKLYPWLRTRHGEA